MSETIHSIGKKKKKSEKSQIRKWAFESLIPQCEHHLSSLASQLNIILWEWLYFKSRVVLNISIYDNIVTQFS